MSQPESKTFENIDRYRCTDAHVRLAFSAPTSFKTRKTNEIFLKGPIPISWLKAAAQLSGKAALVTGLALWHLVGMRKSLQVRLSNKVMERLGSTRKIKYRGLKLLETAKLVRVEKMPRKSLMVTILDVPDL